MCGRFFILATPTDIADLFGLADVPMVASRYNVVPTQSILTVGPDRAGLPAAALFCWGLVPPCASDPKPGSVNARSETAADKPTFAESLRKRRCLIPASGFYEWMKQARTKQPFAFRMADDRPFAFAGLWEAWRPESGPPLLTCCILTTAANDLVQPAHDRMPVILDRQYYAEWIDRAIQDPKALAPMLRPFAADRMRAFPVSQWVNDAHHEDARCLEPLT